MRWPKTIGGWLGFTFKILGTVVAAGPAITAVQGCVQRQDFSTIGKDVLYNYTGYSADTGSMNAGQTGVGIASVAGGLGLITLGKFLSKAVR